MLVCYSACISSPVTFLSVPCQYVSHASVTFVHVSPVRVIFVFHPSVCVCVCVCARVCVCVAVSVFMCVCVICVFVICVSLLCVTCVCVAHVYVSSLGVICMSQNQRSCHELQDDVNIDKSLYQQQSSNELQDQIQTRSSTGNGTSYKKRTNSNVYEILLYQSSKRLMYMKRFFIQKSI